MLLSILFFLVLNSVYLSEINDLSIARVLGFTTTNHHIYLQYADLKSRQVKFAQYDVAQKQSRIFEIESKHASVVKFVTIQSEALVFQVIHKEGLLVTRLKPDGYTEELKHLPKLANQIQNRRLVTATVHQKDEVFLFFEGNYSTRQYLLLMLDLSTGKVKWSRDIPTAEYHKHSYVSFQGKLLEFDRDTGQLQILNHETLEPVKVLLPAKPLLNMKPPEKTPGYRRYIMLIHPSNDRLQVEFSDNTMGKDASARKRMKVMTIDKDFNISYDKKFVLFENDKEVYWLSFPKQRIFYRPKSK